MHAIHRAASLFLPTEGFLPYRVSPGAKVGLQLFPPRPQPLRNQGLTLLDVAFYVLILGIIGALLGPLTQVSTQSVLDSQSFSKTGERNRVTLLKLEQEVRRALAPTVVVGNGGQQILFTLPGGFDGTNIIPGPDIRYDLQADPQETINGVDDNGNGLVDEGVLVRSNVATGEAVTVCSGLMLAASGFVLAGTGVTLNVTNFSGLSDGESTFQVTRSITVYPRN